MHGKTERNSRGIRKKKGGEGPRPKHNREEQRSRKGRPPRKAED